MTLCCVYNDTHILLGEIKKDGILNGKYNGFGGKLEENETIDQAAKRELFEEALIIPLDMKKRGEITFEFEPEGNPFKGNPSVEVHVYSVTEFEGNPGETEEMKPQWFLHSEIPFDRMWPDDPYWLPMILAGKNFRGKFYLKDSNVITKHFIEEVI